jgi:hypothetical protein
MTAAPIATIDRLKPVTIIGQFGHEETFVRRYRMAGRGAMAAI